MKIVVTNLQNPSTLHYPVVLVVGSLENYSGQVWRDHGSETFLVLIISHKETNVRRVQEVPMVNLKFKTLVQLDPGENRLTFEFLGITSSLLLVYQRPHSVEHFIRLVYIVCKGHDGSFQSPPDRDNSTSAALKKVGLAGQVLQAVMAETLHQQPGVGRATFLLEENKEGPLVHLHHSNLSVEQTWAMSGEQLWQVLAREIMSSGLGSKNVKFLAFLSSTRYLNKMGVKPFSHSHAIRMSRGQVTLGGGGLALHSTGCLWTWPDRLDHVQKALLDTQLVDSRMYLDDSAYRGTLGGCLATTMGSVLHELGHCFGLGHSEEGIMDRGFDSLDSFLTVGDLIIENSKRGDLRPCGGFSKASKMSMKTGVSRCNTFHLGEGGPKFTKVKRGEVVAKYLEEFQGRKARRVGEGCAWSRSCALILSSQLWIGPPWGKVGRGVNCSGEEVTILGQEVMVCCEVKVVEVRGDRGMVLHYWEAGEGVKVVRMEMEVLERLKVEETAELELVVVTGCGNLKKFPLRA